MMKKMRKVILAILLVFVLVFTAGCSAMPFEVSDSPDKDKGKSDESVISNTSSKDNSNMPKEYLDLLDKGWKVPTNADLLGTKWNWDGEIENKGYFKYYLTFDEWTVDVAWYQEIITSDGELSGENHDFLGASYELSNVEDLAVLEIDLREMNGKMYFNILISPENDKLYFMQDVSSGKENNDSEHIYPTLNKNNAPDPMGIIGKWDCIKTMIEGDEDVPESNDYTVEITGDSEENMIITYNERQFKDMNFSKKKLKVVNGEIYDTCGNSFWLAEVDHVGKYDTTYSVTLLEDGTLLMSFFWLTDGAPTVSYKWFKKVS